MKNSKKALLIMLFAALLLFSACSAQTGELLQQDKANVTSAVIYYDDGAQIDLTATDEQLAALTDALLKTGTEEKAIDQTNFFSTNKYAIDVTYSDGSVTQLFSDPEGGYFFRFINNDQSYLGGENDKLAKLLEEIKSK